MGGLVLITGVPATSSINNFTVDTAPIIINAPSTQTITLGSSSDFSVVSGLSITIPIRPDRTSGALLNGSAGIGNGHFTQADTTNSYGNTANIDFTETDSSIFDTFVLSLLTIDRGNVTSIQSVNTISDLLFTPSVFGDVGNVNSFNLLIHNSIAVDATFDSFGTFGSQRETPPDADPKSAAFLLIGAGFLGFAGFHARKSN